MVSNLNQSLLSQQVRSDNFTPQLSAKLSVSNTNSMVTFATLTGTLATTFKISNKGSNGAYLGWGVTTASANTSSLTPQANCDYISAGTIQTLSFQSANGIVDTIAAIQDGGVTTLEISIGFGN